MHIIILLAILLKVALEPWAVAEMGSKEPFCYSFEVPIVPHSNSMNQVWKKGMQIFSQLHQYSYTGEVSTNLIQAIRFSRPWAKQIIPPMHQAFVLFSCKLG